MTRRENARPCMLAGAGLVLCAAASLADPLDANIGRFQLATSGSSAGDSVAAFATDGKIGPENRWLTSNTGVHRLNIFFGRETEIGSIHVYSGGERDGPVGTFSVQYFDASGSLQIVPGAVVSGNTQGFVDLGFATPVTTDQLHLTIQDATATIREVAVFPPSAQPFPVGSGVNVNLARQHRVPLTPASSTAAGSSRRAVADGFVNDTDYWQSSALFNQWITLDLRDPPETNPVSVRAVTSPVEIGSVHLYSGLAGGAAPVSSGRFQSLDEGTGVWGDIPGGSFAGNTSGELAIGFDAPVTTAAIRLVVHDQGGVVREIVPLPPSDAGGWPIGTGVVFAEKPDATAYDDDFHAIEIDRSGVALASGAGGQVLVRDAATTIAQHYQVLLNVGTDTYRIRSRVTGSCLEPAGASEDIGAPIVEAAYLGYPSQRWRIESVPGGVRFVNSRSGLILSAIDEADGAGVEQREAGGPGQAWTIEHREHAPKKGTGGWGNLAGLFGITWGYNWGPTDNFPGPIEFWPMQWGSFSWTQRPSLAPEWRRNGEPVVLMGYNEPDKADQANLSVDIAASMWPRMEAMDTPLLGPAVAGHPANSPWIQGFMARAGSDELRVDYVGMHSYGGPYPDSFINQITSARSAWGRDVVVSEFSVVDWSNTNNWTTEPVYNFFAEVLWRMELLPSVHRYAVFVFTDDPSNPISDNRGEMREANGSLTPEGLLYAAWDGDTQVRTDTPYHIHNKASYKRFGAVSGQSGAGSVVLGGRYDNDELFEWRLAPTETPGLYNIVSVSEGLLLTYSALGVQLHPEGGIGMVAEFGVEEIQHGWFAIVEPTLNRRLRSDPAAGGQIGLAPAGTTTDDVRWRFAPVYGGVPGPPRGGQAESVGGGDVSLTWEPHGFRDLIGFTVYRSGPGGGDAEPIAAGIPGESWIDHVPEPGTYTYSVSAVGDTGESDLAAIGAVSVDTCPADFNADFVVDEADIEALIDAVGAGLDYDGDGSADFFDVLSFLRVYDGGCPGG